MRSISSGTAPDVEGFAKDRAPIFSFNVYQMLGQLDYHPNVPFEDFQNEYSLPSLPYRMTYYLNQCTMLNPSDSHLSMYKMMHV